MYSIKVSVVGGLGNQLFMIFAIMSYAIDNTLNFIIYTINNPKIGTQKYYWDNLLDAIKDKITDKYDNTIQTYNVIKPEYAPIPVFNSDFNIRGYFESYKYFEKNYEQIMQTLKIYDKQNIVKNKYNSYFNKKTIAIHFKIGDLVDIDKNKFINVFNPIYYENALSYLEQKINIKDDYNILYFCDKKDNDKVNNDYISVINKNRNYNFIKVSDDIEDYEQLLLMSCCDHLIIANSTFSYFGAYFCNNKYKIVIYPSKWFGEKNKSDTNTNDLCPKNWIQISRN